MIQQKKTKSDQATWAKTEIASTILMVDDLPENLLTLESVLSNNKRKFLKAESGNEALKLALNQPISLIMMDIQMPEMDGIETSRLLRLNPRTRHIPILFVSAINPKEKHPLIEFEPGTVDFLFKPLNLEDTKTKVCLFEKLWLLQQEASVLQKKHDQLSMDYDRFIYMVSHDLKAPLRAVTNLTTWIDEDLGNTSSANVKENLSLLQERVSRMNQMIDGILEFSRAGRIQESPVQTNLKKLVAGVFESLQNTSGFRLNLTGHWPDLFTEQLKLEKVFRQLIGNSLMHHDRKEGEVTVHCLPAGSKIQFSVADDGPGILPIYYKTIFELFQTLKPKDEKNNSGTGLAIAKKIIEDQGGTITVEPNAPRGVLFTFSWPC